MRGRGRLEGNALAFAGSFVGGRGSKSVNAKIKAPMKEYLIRNNQ